MLALSPLRLLSESVGGGDAPQAKPEKARYPATIGGFHIEPRPRRPFSFALGRPSPLLSRTARAFGGDPSSLHEAQGREGAGVDEGKSGVGTSRGGLCGSEGPRASLLSPPPFLSSGRRAPSKHVIVAPSPFSGVVVVFLLVLLRVPSERVTEKATAADEEEQEEEGRSPRSLLLLPLLLLLRRRRLRSPPDSRLLQEAKYLESTPFPLLASFSALLSSSFLSRSDSLSTTAHK